MVTTKREREKLLVAGRESYQLGSYGNYGRASIYPGQLNQKVSTGCMQEKGMGEGT